MEKRNKKISPAKENLLEYLKKFDDEVDTCFLNNLHHHEEEGKLICFNFSIHICLEKGIFVSVLKEHFDMFSKVKKVISDRILLALGVNPYQSYEKLNW